MFYGIWVEGIMVEGFRSEGFVVCGGGGDNFRVKFLEKNRRVIRNVWG